MTAKEILQLAERLQSGSISVDQFVELAGKQHSAEIDDVHLDLDRRRRCGYPEVIYGEGKSPETIARIFETLLAAGHDAFATRISPDKADVLCKLFPAGRYNALARTFRIAPSDGHQSQNAGEPHGRITIVTAGTSDRPVAEEARETADWMGVDVRMVHDVGVAGPHRLREKLDQLDGAHAVVVIAGMEGALPSVVGGYVACPVVAVPTSVGYGASFGGVVAMLGMLNSCASNVTVVNIDSGFKGAYVASLIAKQTAAART